MRRFDDLDVNYDSKLESQEFASFAGNDQYTSYVFDHLDMSKDGFITEEEIQNALEMFEQKVNAVSPTEFPEDAITVDALSMIPPTDPPSPEDILRGNH